MNRGFLIACALTAAAIAATLSVRACAEQPAKTASAAPTAASPLSQWQEGTNYTVLPNPQSPAVKGRVVVNEIFWYGCSH